MEAIMDTILYECMQCHTISPFDDFEDLECDGDIWGLCPHCGQTGMILEVDTSEPADKIKDVHVF